MMPKNPPAFPTPSLFWKSAIQKGTYISHIQSRLHIYSPIARTMKVEVRQKKRILKAMDFRSEARLRFTSTRELYGCLEKTGEETYKKRNVTTIQAVR
jgi:hypothetical protein